MGKENTRKENLIPSHKFGVCNEGETLFVRVTKIVNHV